MALFRDDIKYFVLSECRSAAAGAAIPYEYRLAANIYVMCNKHRISATFLYCLHVGS